MTASSSSQSHETLEITPHDAFRWLDRARDADRPLLLDCRTPEEHHHVSIDGSRLLPMQELEQRLDEIEPYRNRPIIVYCHHGRRSLRVTHALRQRGFADVLSLAGGIDRWSVEIDPSIPRY